MQDNAAEELPPEENKPEQETPAELSPEEQLQKRIAELEAQAASYKDQALRALAEAENTRRRAAKEMEDSARYGVSNFARDMVGVVENLQLALAHITPEQREKDELLKTLAEGVEMVLKETLGTLSRHGVVRIDPVGQKFDHNFHQAVAQIESADAAPNTVLQVLQAGYIIHDRLLRPAMVTVAKAPAKKES